MNANTTHPLDIRVFTLSRRLLSVVDGRKTTFESPLPSKRVTEKEHPHPRPVRVVALRPCRQRLLGALRVKGTVVRTTHPRLIGSTAPTVRVTVSDVNCSYPGPPHPSYSHPTTSGYKEKVTNRHTHIKCVRTS